MLVKLTNGGFYLLRFYECRNVMVKSCQRHHFKYLLSFVIQIIFVLRNTDTNKYYWKALLFEYRLLHYSFSGQIFQTNIYYIVGPIQITRDTFLAYFIPPPQFVIW